MAYTFPLKGQYPHDQQGMESECRFKINSVTENNTPHAKVIIITVWRIKLGHRFHALLKVLWSLRHCPFNYVYINATLVLSFVCFGFVCLSRDPPNSNGLRLPLYKPNLTGTSALTKSAETYT